MIARQRVHRVDIHDVKVGGVDTTDELLGEESLASQTFSFIRMIMLLIMTLLGTKMWFSSESSKIVYPREITCTTAVTKPFGVVNWTWSPTLIGRYNTREKPATTLLSVLCAARPNTTETTLAPASRAVPTDRKSGIR